MLFRVLLVTGLLAVPTPAQEEEACKHGTARLHDGENYYSGTAQFCKRGRWMYFTYTGWGERESRVVCNQLGYSQAEGDPSSNPLPDSENIEFVSISCLGSETAISLCRPTFESNGLTNQRNGINVACKPAGPKLFWDKTLLWMVLQLCEALLVAIGILVWMVKICWGCGCCDCCCCKKSKKKKRNQRNERGIRNERGADNLHSNGQRQFVRPTYIT